MQGSRTAARSIVSGLIIGCSGLISILFLDKNYWQIEILGEGWPKSSFDFIMRSAAIALFVILVIGAFARKKSTDLPLRLSVNSTGQRVSLFFIYSMSTLFLFLFLYKAPIFCQMALEDGVIEWGTAILFFLCCLIFVRAFFKFYPSKKIHWFIKLSLAGLAFGFFLLTMEEISWFQRVFDIDTPPLLEGNYQNEINLHNYFTNYAEALFYSGTFFFLVFFPFIDGMASLFNQKLNFLRVFVAGLTTLIIAAIACAYNFDMWNALPTQVSFYSSVFILFILAVLSREQKDRYLILFAMILTIFSQAIFLNYGEHFDRLWDVTEYKELIFAIAYFSYSTEVFGRLNKICANHGEINQ